MDHSKTSTFDVFSSLLNSCWLATSLTANRQSSERGRMRICDFMSALWNDETNMSFKLILINFT